MQKLTRKHFILIADALNESKPCEINPPLLSRQVRMEQWLECVEAIAYALKTTNSDFDVERFVKLCADGTESSEEG